MLTNWGLFLKLFFAVSSLSLMSSTMNVEEIREWLTYLKNQIREQWHHYEGLVFIPVPLTRKTRRVSIPQNQLHSGQKGPPPSENLKSQAPASIDDDRVTCYVGRLQGWAQGDRTINQGSHRVCFSNSSMTDIAKPFTLRVKGALNKENSQNLNSILDDLKSSCSCGLASGWCFSICHILSKSMRYLVSQSEN